MRITLVASLACIMATPVTAQPAAIQVHLSNFKFEPKAIELRADTDYALTLINDGGGGHSFSAKAFFAAAKVDAADLISMKDGTIEVPGNGRQTIRFHTGGPGTYKTKCTHAFHSGFGMKGEIVVR